MGFSVQSIWKRIPIVLAPPLGGYLLTRFGVVSGMHIGFLVSLLFALAAIYLQSRFYREKPRSHNEQREGIVTIWRMMPGTLRQLLLADCFARFGSSLTAVYVVLLVINIRGISLVAFGALTSVQMLTAIAGYIPAAHYADRFGRRPFILVTFALFALFPIILRRRAARTGRAGSQSAHCRSGGCIPSWTRDRILLPHPWPGHHTRPIIGGLALATRLLMALHHWRRHLRHRIRYLLCHECAHHRGIQCVRFRERCVYIHPLMLQGSKPLEIPLPFPFLAH
jgi:MFS family permease